MNLKVTVWGLMRSNVETLGHSVELSHDGKRASMKVYSAHSASSAEIHGTPRELRRFARSILDGLKRDTGRTE